MAAAARVIRVLCVGYMEAFRRYVSCQSNDCALFIVLQLFERARVG